MTMAERTRKTVAALVSVALSVILLSCRGTQTRPANVPKIAVLVNGDYIACTPPLPEEEKIGEINQHPCTVYNGSTGEVMGRDALEVRLRDIASRKGGSAIDCGQSSTRPTDARISECVQKAFQNGKAFFVRYDTAAAFSHGLAGDADGNVSSVVYDLRTFPAIAATRFTQLFDGNHTKVTSCVRPITLGTEDGELACITPINEVASAIAAQQKPVETTVCAVLENPAAFNNRIVRLHGHLWINFEYSMLSGDGCSGRIWFEYAGENGPPGLVLYPGGEATPGAQDPDGKRILPVPVKLVRDQNLNRFETLMKSRAGPDQYRRGIKSCGFPFHQVSATFWGRMDVVSQDPRISSDAIRKSETRPAGLLRCQFVMQSVENDAILEKRCP